VNAKILDIAGFLPDEILTNDYLAQIYPDWPAEKIYEKTGIKTRHIAASDETAADLACKAAQKLFSQGRCKAEDVDFIILVTQAPDYILPTSACLIQHRLGIRTTAGAIDINLGCSGYVYGLAVAKGLLETGSAKCILLLTADTYSKYIHPMDKSVRTLFGDGAAATVIVSEKDARVQAMGPFVFGTNGDGGKNLIIEAGGFRCPKNELSSVEEIDASNNIRSSENLFMNGSAVMSFTLTEVPRAVQNLLDLAKTEKKEIDYFVLHQANKFMLDALGKKLKVSLEKLPVLMEDIGNTVSSSIPQALMQMRRNGCFGNPKKIMLVGFGVGYSWAACLLTVDLGVSNE
jgi:3-oxoacyl-[acyl-carrier-protein] synthase-3